jgi:hypothetical protein
LRMARHAHERAGFFGDQTRIIVLSYRPMSNPRSDYPVLRALIG